MKRVFAFFLALLMIVALVGCANNSQQVGSTPGTSASVPTEAPTDPTGSKPTPSYETLYNYIVENGQSQDNAWVYTYTETDTATCTLTMIADASGSIRWKIGGEEGGFTLELELGKDSRNHPVTLTYLTYTACATAQDTEGFYTDFTHTAPEEQAETLRSLMDSKLPAMMLCAAQALEPAGFDLTVFLLDPTEVEHPVIPPTTNPPDPAILGKYRLYCIDAPGNYQDYKTLVANGLGSTYLLLNADGTAEISTGSQVQSDKTWDHNAMTLTDGNGNTFPMVIEGEMLTVSGEESTNIYYKETSSIWEQTPTFYDHVYELIVSRGKSQDGAWVYSFTSSGSTTVTMTATAEGSIFWGYDSGTFQLSLQLPEMPQSVEVTMEYNGMRATLTLLNATGEFDELSFDGPGAYATLFRSMAKTGITGLFYYAGSLLQPAGVTIADLFL